MMRSVVSILVFAGLGGAEKTWLARFESFPKEKTLQVVSFLTVDAKESPEISIQGPVSLLGDEQPSEGNSLQVSIIPHVSLAALGDQSSFCCSPVDIEKKKCSAPDSLSVSGAYSWSLSRESLKSGEFGKAVFRPEVTGLYYVTMSNCGTKDADTVQFASGELSMVGKSGFLPGEEVKKLSFYFYLACGYALLLSIWCVWCKAWSDVLFKIHHHITVTIAVGLLEAVCWYASLYHWNFLGHRWWSMIALASLGTVCKQGVSYGLLLSACLGSGVTKPRLDSKQTVQGILLVLAFIVSDGARGVSLLLQDRVNGASSTWKVILLVTPGSLFVSVLYVWIIQALQDTIGELQLRKQTVKVEVYQQLRVALGFVVVIIVALTLYETGVVRRTELATNWESRYLFTDVASHLCFFFLVTILMYLWRPNERSLQMAYSEQLEDQEGGTQMGNPTEEDFESVDVELGDDPAESGDYDFKKSMEEAKAAKQKVPGVLE